MLNRLLCFFGVHSWVYTSTKGRAYRYCSRCDETQEAVYDSYHDCIFHIGDEVTVEAKKNLNDGIVTGILTSITGNYISISVPGYVLVTRCTSILKKDHT
jgi:hypothetical protein